MKNSHIFAMSVPLAKRGRHHGSVYVSSCMNGKGDCLLVPDRALREVSKKVRVVANIGRTESTCKCRCVFGGYGRGKMREMSTSSLMAVRSNC